MDEQRVERLKQCRILEDIAAECRRPTKEGSDRIHLEDVPIGFRQVRYFRWRNLHEHESTCQREIHAIWSCRAIALHCGAELVELRRCFDKLQETNPSAILKQSETAYEAENASSELPCRSLQVQLGECVKRNSTELQKRCASRLEKK
jgi:hypothetical protein